MKSLKLNSCFALASAVALAACASESSGPTSLSPSSARFHAVGDVVTDATPEVGVVKLCKEGNVGGDFMVSRTPYNGGTGSVISPVQVAVNECKVVAVDNSGSGSASDIVIDETTTGLTSQSASYVGTDAGEAGTYVDATTSLRINQFHGYTVTYVNVSHEDEGCTLTQGYWKNHSEEWADLADDPFFGSGMTWLGILQTPPKKGNAYIQLAHQYIAAYLNIQAGASTTPAVDAAIADAEAYFGGDLTVNISGLATTLDEYNNGLIGPGHCDDQEAVN
jgi:hypothetical protein